jgi:hypothetical protein
MLEGIINWFRKKTSIIFPQNDIVEVLSAPIKKTNINKTYLVDASVPTLINDAPTPTSTLLPMMAKQESGGGFALGSAQQQAAGLRQIVNDALVFMNSKSPKKITKWAATNNLMLIARAGVDANAYYDRQSLKFFYFPDNIRKKNVFACDSRAVVTHEFGHALLDSIRPDLWSVMSEEIWAYHEAFGDMVALLNSLQYEKIIDFALKETNNDLKKSNIISRLASDMGIGLYNASNRNPNYYSNCLRDMSIVFKYVDPKSLPKEGSDATLLNECHSFGRVFSSMFYYLLLEVTNVYVQEKLTLKDALKKARDIMATYLMQASANASISPKFFKSICQEFLVADKKMTGKFQKLFYDTFISWKIIEGEIKILSKVTVDDVMKNSNGDFIFSDEGTIKVLRILNKKNIKLSDIIGVVALTNNSLLDAEIETASESSFYFNENAILEMAIESTQKETIESALNCIEILNLKQMIGNHEKAIFEIIDGKIIRRQIQCGCNKPNYCIPGAPEYQKPWKPKNNAGCVKCGKSNCEPKSCDCAAPPTPTPVKMGCYTKINAGAKSSYSVGSKTSRKVC